jgi:NADPH:quinone reductase-like Zn-dependent oxidoreductase
VQTTRFGGPEVLEIVDIPEPEAGPGQKLYDVSTAGINYADTHQSLSRELPRSGLIHLHAFTCRRTRRSEVRS